MNGEDLMMTDADYYSAKSDKVDGLSSDRVFFEQKWEMRGRGLIFIKGLHGRRGDTSIRDNAQ